MKYDLLKSLIQCQGLLKYAIDYECKTSYEKVQYNLEALGFNPEIWICNGGKLTKLIDTQIEHLKDTLINDQYNDQLLEAI